MNFREHLEKTAGASGDALNDPRLTAFLEGFQEEMEKVAVSSAWAHKKLVGNATEGMVGSGGGIARRIAREGGVPSEKTTRQVNAVYHHLDEKTNGLGASLDRAVDAVQARPAYAVADANLTTARKNWRGHIEPLDDIWRARENLKVPWRSKYAPEASAVKPTGR